MGAAKTISQAKGHRTKAEKKIREDGEKSIVSGKALIEFDEVKNSEVAHKEFKRIKKLLKTIDKDDAIFSAVVNRYCKIREEITELEGFRAKATENMSELERREQENEIEFETYLERADYLSKTIAAYDRQIATKRKMCFDIEREMCMTVASGIRNIPKKPDDEKKNPLFAALMDNDG